MFTDPFHCAFRDRKLQPNYCLSLVTLTGLQTCLLPAEPFFRLFDFSVLEKDSA